MRIIKYIILCLTLTTIVINCGTNRKGTDIQSGLEASTGVTLTESDRIIRTLDVNVFVTMLYQGILWRNPDFPGASGYVSNIRNNGMAGLRNSGRSISTSSEFFSQISPNKKSATAILDRLYQYLLQRSLRPDGHYYDPGGVPYLIYINSGRTDIVVDSILSSREFAEKLLASVTGGGSGPNPTATPPNPTPTATPVAGCNSDPDTWTPSPVKHGPSRINEVNAAIDIVVATHPEWFNGDIVLGDCHESAGRFFAELSRVMNSRGLCTYYGGDAIHPISTTPGFAEEFHLIAFGGCILRHANGNIHNYIGDWDMH